MKKAKEVNEKYMKEIYLNILKAIVIVLYFLVLNLSYENVRSEYLDIAIKVFTMTFLFIAIFIFEKAYKKDDGNLAMQGIEVLLLATYTLTTEHITNKFHFNFKSYSLVASYLFATYFILKSIITYTKGRKELVEERSDIREIVKKNEPTKKENTKRAKDDKSDNEEEKELNEIPISTKKKSTEKTTEVKKTTTRKRSTASVTKEEKGTSQTRKKVTSSVPKEKNETIQKKKKTTSNKSETTTKKATTTKKKTTVSKLEDTKAEDKKVEQEEKPKRKRVKKEVTEND